MGFIIYRQKYGSALHSFGIEYIPQDVLNKIKDKPITHNIFRIQSDDYIMWGSYYIASREYMIGWKTQIISIYFHLMTIKMMRK